MILNFAICVLAGYVSGSVLYGYILPKAIKGVDVRSKADDANPGTANAFLYAGGGVGTAVLIADLAKGFLPVYLAQRFVPVNHICFALVIAAPVIGHAFPLFGKGGKCVAVSFGVLAGLFPVLRPFAILAITYIFFSAVIVIRPHRLRSIVTYAILSIATFALCRTASVRLGCLLVSAVVIVRHVTAQNAGEAGERGVFLFGKIGIWQEAKAGAVEETVVSASSADEITDEAAGKSRIKKANQSR